MMRIVNYRSLLETLVLLLFSGTLSAQDKSVIVGKWTAEDRSNRQIEVYLGKDQLYYAVIVADGGASKNEGKIMMKKLNYDDKTNHYIGIMNPPDVNMDIPVTVSFVSNDKLKILAKKLMITKTFYFIRIKK